MKITKAELRKLARQIIATNLAMWQAIHGAEELYYDKVRHMSEENIEELVKIMITLKMERSRWQTQNVMVCIFRSLSILETDYKSI